MTDLVRKSKKGDKEAFALLIDMHRQLLYNTALLTLHQEDDALDAIQDTILACWENLPTLQKNQYFKTWLVRILLTSRIGIPLWTCVTLWKSLGTRTN